MPDVLMPRLSDSMEEGTIVAWLVADGDAVRRGQQIVEIETDKATMSWEADADGVLRIVAGTGQALPPGSPIALIGEHAADDASDPRAAAPVGGGPPDATDDRAEDAPGTPVGPTDAAAGAPPVTDAPTGDAPAPMAEPPADAPVAPSAPDGQTAVGPATSRVRAPSRLESIVAERMTRSRTEMPSFTVSSDVEVDALLAHRIEMKRGAAGRAVPSVNDLVVRACAVALRDHPRVNAAWTADGILERDEVHVGIAVATDDDGLVVPVVRHADEVPLSTLAATSKDLTKRARAGRLTPADLDGATFTVSNLGPFGVRTFDAIVSPGQAAIVAVGAVHPAVVVRDGAPVVRQLVTLAVSADHRVVYGAHAAAFLERVRGLLEHPAALGL